MIGRLRTLAHRYIGAWLAIAFVASLAACGLANPGLVATETLPADLATGTAIVAGKYTHAAERSEHPATAEPTEVRLFPTMAWTPSPGEMTASDSGKSIDISITVRVSVILEEAQYPEANLMEECVPEGIIGRVSNIPAVSPGFYVVRYEGVELGRCTIRNGQFHVVINVVNRP